MYCVTNFRSKKELKEAVKNGQAGGVYQVGPFGGGDYSNGQFAVEGPHYPEAHRWYGQVTVRDGQIVSAK